MERQPICVISERLHMSALFIQKQEEGGVTIAESMVDGCCCTNTFHCFFSSLSLG